MSVVKRNIAANFGGNVWAGLMSFVFVPVYIHFIGIEAYGLVGIFAALLALFGLLDLGLSTTLNREMARLSVQKNKAQEMRDLVRTLEIPYWAVGLLISIIVISLSPFISIRWVNVEHLSQNSVQTAIIIMGVVVAFQWPLSVYSGTLMGLQRQVLLSSVNAGMATVRGVGAVLVLWLMSSTVEAFFLWQLIVSIVHIIVAFFFSWRSLPHAAGAQRFRLELFVKIRRFAAGMAGITILVTILMQMDKIILSRMLSLEMFGYYTLAGVVAINLTRLISPIFSAIYPRLTNLVELGHTQDMTRLYHQGAQLVSVIVIPAALVLALFSREILLLWTRSSETTDNTHALLSILAIGTGINALMYLPNALQLAHGWTRLAFFANLASVLLLVPLVIVLTNRYGAAGAASVWVILNVGYMFISVPIMHRRLLPAENWRWYREDIGYPLVVALVIVLIGRTFIRPDWPPVALAGSIGVLSVATILASALAANKLNTLGRIKSYPAVIRSGKLGFIDS